LSPGAIVELRSRLWRVDDLLGDVLVATTIDGAPAVKRRFYLPFEKVALSEIVPPSPEIVGNFAAQDLLLRSQMIEVMIWMSIDRYAIGILVIFGREKELNRNFNRYSYCSSRQFS